MLSVHHRARTHTDLFKNTIAAVNESVESLDVGAFQDGVTEDSLSHVRDAIDVTERRAEQMNKEVLEGLWAQFDRDKNGVLDRQECARLLREYFSSAKTYMPQIVMDSIGAGLEATAQLFDQRLSAYEAAEFRMRMDAILKRMAKDVKILVVDALRELKENVDDHAEVLLRELDLDGNGSVEQSEFVSHFLTAITKIVDPNHFTSTASEQVMEQLGLRRAAASAAASAGASAGAGVSTDRSAGTPAPASPKPRLGPKPAKRT